MFISSRTPEGTPHHCPVCGADVRIEPSRPGNDAPCPHCGALLWFKADAPKTAAGIEAEWVVSAPSRPRGLTAWFVAGAALLRALPAIMAVLLSYFALRLLDLGPTEHFIIMFLAILLFGRQLPEMGRYFGKRIVGQDGS